MKVGFFHLNMIYFILRYRCSTVHNRDVLLCGAYWTGGVCSGDLGDHTSGTDIHSLRPPLQTPPIHYWFWNLLVRHPATTGTDADISTMETVVTYLKNQNKNTIVSTHETAFPLHSLISELSLNGDLSDIQSISGSSSISMPARLLRCSQERRLPLNTLNMIMFHWSSQSDWTKCIGRKKWNAHKLCLRI